MRRPVISQNLWAVVASVLLNGGFLFAAAYSGFQRPIAPLRETTIDLSIEPIYLSADVAKTAEAPPPSGAVVPPEKADLPESTQPPKPLPPVDKPLPKPTAVSDKAFEAPAEAPKHAARANAPSDTPSNKAANATTSGPPSSNPPSEAPANSRSGAKHTASYSALIRRHLELFKQYPRAAKRRREVGVVTLAFVIDRQGRVLSSRIVESSGSKDLDQAALEMLEAAQPLPKPPSDITGTRIEMVTPVEFSLEN